MKLLTRAGLFDKYDWNLPEFPSVPVRLRELTPLNDEDWLAELLLRRFQSELFDYYRSKRELSVVTHVVY